MSQGSTKPIGRARFHFAILTHGQLDATRRCLRTLAATVPAPFQVFVVDNASTDGTVDWLQACSEPWLHWRTNAENRGVPGGRNDLLDFAMPHLDARDWLVFCDNDLEFGPGWLEPFEAAMRAWPEARVLGKVGHFLDVRERSRVLLPAATATGPADVLSGGFACMVRADAAAAIGRFDEQLGLFWHEDDDYCVRALQLGLEVVAVPEAAIVHHEHATGAASAGLREGGSLRNQQYLVQKWRAAGWVDGGGWVRRAPGCYQPPEVRDALRRRGGLPTPIGRAEFAAAWRLLDRLVAAEDPAREFALRGEPVPRCFEALLQWNRECAAQGRASDLIVQLDRAAAAVRTFCYAARLQPIVRVPEQTVGSTAGHGLCASRDFDDPDWLQLADELVPGNCARDPHGRDRIVWEQVSTLAALVQGGGVRSGARLLVVGEPRPQLCDGLGVRGMQVATFDPAKPPPAGSCDAVLFDRRFDPDLVASVVPLATATALFVFVGECALNGVPTCNRPVPMQLEHDLLARAGLQPVAPIRTEVDPKVLDACADSATATLRWPHLCELDKAQLFTSFVIAGRRVPAPATPAATVVLAPAPQLRVQADRATPAATVGVDLRTVAYADSTSRGIGHYTLQHLAAVARRAPELWLRCYLPAGVALPAALRLANVQSARLDDWDPRTVDLVHLPDPMNLSIGFDSPLRVFRHERTTVTFHDLTPLRHYIDQWPRRNREAYLDRLRQLEDPRVRLLCNSRFTAADVIATLRRDPDTVTPILAGLHGRTAAVDDATRVAVLRRLGLLRMDRHVPFLLHVGALDPHKNFAATLSAFLQVRQQRPLHLVVVGAIDPGIEYFAGFCASRKIPDVVFTGYLPRPDLDALYRAATALVFLSRSEGFGFPLLEAMAAGCPVVGSDATSHPEVTGDAGLLVPVDGAARWAAAAVVQLLDDPARSQRCRELGRTRARSFAWDAVADRTLSVWRAMLGERADQACTPGASVPVFSTHST